MSTKEINPVTSKSVSNVSDNQSIMKIEHKIDNEYVEIQNLDTKKFLNKNQISQSIDSNKQRSDELQRMPESKIESILQNEEYKNENYSEYRDSLIMNQKFQQNNFDQAKLFEQFKQLTCLPQDSTPSSIVEKSTQSNKYLAPITEKFDDYSTNQIQGREQNTLENIQQELTQLLQPQNHGNYNSQNVKKKQTDNFEFLQQQISKIDNQQYLIYTQQRVHKNKETESDNKENEKIEEKAGEMLLAGSNEQTNEKTMGNENIQLNLQTEPQILVNEYQSYQDQYEDEENVSDGENENDKTYLSLKEQADIISMPRSAKGPSYLYN